MTRMLTPWTAGKNRLMSLFPEWEPLELFERMFPESERRFMGEFAPPVNVAETETAVEISVELPGMKAEEVKVEILEGRLYISGEKKEEVEEKGKTFHRIERRHGEFRRVLTLPANVSEEKVEAKFENGVLKVVLAKTEEAKPKPIAVKTVA